MEKNKKYRIINNDRKKIAYTCEECGNEFVTNRFVPDRLDPIFWIKWICPDCRKREV